MGGQAVDLLVGESRQKRRDKEPDAFFQVTTRMTYGLQLDQTFYHLSHFPN